MNVQLTVVPLWALVAGGPIAMVLTVLVGILVNNSVNKSNIEALRSDLRRVEDTLRTEIRILQADNARIESTLRSQIQRVEGVLSAKIDNLDLRVKGLEEEIRLPLIKQ
jgi:hypothetical protein